MDVKVLGGVPVAGLGHGGMVGGWSRRRSLLVDIAIGVVLCLLAGSARWTSEEYPNPGLVTGLLVGGAGLALRNGGLGLSATPRRRALLGRYLDLPGAWS